MLSNKPAPVRAALKALHDKLIENGDELSLLQADLAFLMAVADQHMVAIDYAGLCAAIVDNDHRALDTLRTKLSSAISKARIEAGCDFDVFEEPWGEAAI